MSKHAELKLRAQAATSGPWIEVDDEDSAAGAVFIVPTADVWTPPICRITSERDSAFIASANPAVVLEFIEDHESMLSALEKLRQAFVISVGDKSPFAKCALSEVDAVIAKAKGE